MADTHDMPERKDDESTLLVHGGGYLAPTVDLRLDEDP